MAAKEWKAISQSTMMREVMVKARKTSLQKTVQVFLIGMKLMLKLSKKIEIVRKEWQLMKERSPIVCTHQLHVMIDLAKTLKTQGISISVKIMVLWSS